MIEISIKVAGGSDYCVWQLPGDDDDLYDVFDVLDEFVCLVQKMRPGTVTDC